MVDEFLTFFSSNPSAKFYTIETNRLESVHTFSDLVRAHGYGVTEHEGVLYVRKSKFSQA